MMRLTRFSLRACTSRWPYRKDHVVVPNRFHELPLIRCARRHAEAPRTIHERIVFRCRFFQSQAIVLNQPLHVIFLQLSIALEVPNEKVPFGSKSIQIRLGTQGFDLISTPHELELGKEGLQLGKFPMADPKELKGRDIRQDKLTFGTHGQKEMWGGCGISRGTFTNLLAAHAQF